jgi:hypothetical protein
VTRQRFAQSFDSPSGKLTYSPEICIPDPKDATSILLQTNAVQQLSSRVRACKANAAFVRCGLDSLAVLCREQASSRGSIPGPVPIVYCTENQRDSPSIKLAEVAEAGADGVLVQVLDGRVVRGAQDIVDAALSEASSWSETTQEARSVGLQAIPEVIVCESAARSWTEDDVTSLIDAVVTAMGDDVPVCVLITVVPTSRFGASQDPADDTAGAQEPQPVALPKIPRALAKRVPIVGSVRAKAGDGRIGLESARMKEAGFTAVLLRSECLPGYRHNQPETQQHLDLDVVGHFWSSCIDDLKSVKSRNFSFRAKNNMEKNRGTVWANYQNSVVESGALGDPNDSYSIVDASAGEYKGFA